MHGRVYIVDRNIDFSMKILPLLGCLLVVISIDCAAKRANAQVGSLTNMVVPDKTLSNQSKLSGNDIHGGVEKDGNLFHSFERFSLGGRSPALWRSRVLG
jgi:large exoprotein involved in heme utilization and adhesion